VPRIGRKLRTNAGDECSVEVRVNRSGGAVEHAIGFRAAHREQSAHAGEQLFAVAEHVEEDERRDHRLEQRHHRPLRERGRVAEVRPRGLTRLRIDIDARAIGPLDDSAHAGRVREPIAHDVLRLLFAHLICSRSRFASELLRNEHARYDDHQNHDQRRQRRGSRAVLGDPPQHPRVERPRDDRQCDAPGDRGEERVRQQRAKSEQYDGQCGQRERAEPLAGRERAFFPNDGRGVALGCRRVSVALHVSSSTPIELGAGG
jgi:hypothetical protein